MAKPQDRILRHLRAIRAGVTRIDERLRRVERRLDPIEEPAP
jgi:hypothetical protein